MPFDFAPLTLHHLFFLLVSFVAVFVGTAVIVRWPITAVRISSQPRAIFYAGWWVTIVLTVLAAVTMPQAVQGLGLVGAALIILVAGRFDERRPLSVSRQLIWQAAAIAAVVAAGWTIPYVTNPWQGGVLELDWQTYGTWLIPGSILAALWLWLLMNAVNWIDGSDGLAGSVAGTAFLALAALSVLPSLQDGTTLQLALIGLGGVLGFLVWNAPPARVHLGTTGSWFIGLYLGLAAMLGGGKIVTTILVLALPLADVGVVVLRRIAAGQLPWRGDTTNHLHHRLQIRGWSPRQVLLFVTAGTMSLAAAAVLLSTAYKVWVIGLVAVMLLSTAGLVRRQHNNQRNV